MTKITQKEQEILMQQIIDEWPPEANAFMTKLESLEDWKQLALMNQMIKHFLFTRACKRKVDFHETLLQQAKLVNEDIIFDNCKTYTSVYQLALFSDYKCIIGTITDVLSVALDWSREFNPYKLKEEDNGKT